MTDIKNIKTSMAWYSIWNAALALLLLMSSLWAYMTDQPASNEILFFMVLALFHSIFSIWFWQGRQLIQYIRASIVLRILLSSVYCYSAWKAYSSCGELGLPKGMVEIYIVYLMTQAVVDFIGAITSAALVRKSETSVFVRPEKQFNTKLDLEIKNRFIFALYMVTLGVWVLLGTDGFLSFFHLPQSEFTGWPSDSRSIPGPIHLIGILVILLAIYNFVAVRYRLEQLINAGVRGGLVTSVFVLLLVASGILHPVTLLIPAVDLISVGVIFFIRFYRMLNHA